MNKPLFGQKVAVLVANGFNEKDLIEMQRMTQGLGAEVRIISMNQGLVNSWNKDGWGLNFATDKVLNEALAADFSILMMPGGQKSAEKLQLTAHTRRIVRGFMETGKPVVAVGEAMELLAYAEQLDDRTVSTLEGMKDMVAQAGATFVEAPYAVDANLMSVAMMDEAGNVLSAMEEFLVADLAMDQAA